MPPQSDSHSRKSKLPVRLWASQAEHHGNFLTVGNILRRILHSMPQTAEHGSPAATDGFAGLLAALASPVRKAEPAWNDDALADDVATLSYERALQARARYRAANPSDYSLTDAVDFSPYPASPAVASAVAAPLPTRATAPVPASVSAPTPLDRNLKCASITIRMSQAECEQLRHRAAEAGLSVSAYLRSCTFEAESLRELVRDTMAQLRSVKEKATQPVPMAQPKQLPERRANGFFAWFSRLFLPRRPVRA